MKMMLCAFPDCPNPKSPKAAAHSCGNGHLGCVHPRHVRWATHTENLADQLVHGTRHQGEVHYAATLTERRVLAIREFAHTMRRASLAAMFGLDIGHVNKIVNRSIWRHV